MKKLKTFSAVAVGNMLEWYDFQIVACLYLTLASKCFPADLDPFLAKWFAVIGSFIAYSAQPIGAIYFSYISDTKGRVKALSKSINFMALGAFILATMPTYNQVGLLCPILFVFARIMQGMSLGAESKHSYIYVLESYNDNKNRYFIVSFLMVCSAFMFFVSGNLGKYINTIVAEDPSSQIWRLPLIIGSVIGMAGIYIRRNLPETMTINENIYDSKLSVSARKFLNTTMQFVKKEKMVVILYCLFNWGWFFVVVIANNFETIISSEIFGLEISGVYIPLSIMIIFPLLGKFFYSPKNGRHALSIAHKITMLTTLLLIVIYGLLFMVSIDQYLYRFVGVLVNLAFSFLFFNSLLVYMYFIPMNVRCSVVSFCAGCVGALSQFTILPMAMKLKHDYGNKSYLFIYAICLSFGISLFCKYVLKSKFEGKKEEELQLDIA